MWVEGAQRAELRAGSAVLTPLLHLVYREEILYPLSIFVDLQQLLFPPVLEAQTWAQVGPDVGRAEGTVPSLSLLPPLC